MRASRDGFTGLAAFESKASGLGSRPRTHERWGYMAFWPLFGEACAFVAHRASGVGERGRSWENGSDDIGGVRPIKGVGTVGAWTGVSASRWEGSPMANEDGLKRCEEMVHNVVGEAS